MTKTTTAPKSENKKVICYINDHRFIPVIFIPGIMGSNLKGKCDPAKDKRCPVTPEQAKKKSDELWRLDGSLSLAKWVVRDAVDRKRMLHPDRVEVDDLGAIPFYIDPAEISEYENDHPYNENDSLEKKQQFWQNITGFMLNNPEEELFGSRHARGWGEVGNMSYGEFLDKLQKALHRDKPCMNWAADDNGVIDPPQGKLEYRGIWQEIVAKPLGLEYPAATAEDTLEESQLKVLADYLFPVYAVGYNWLGSNKDSASLLLEKIKKIISDCQDKGHCQKVILVTHSMGGLVARYCSEVLSGQDKIYGIVHGVMPATGAAAAYTRMKRGTENTENSLTGYITTHILGRDAAEMTAVCSQSPGPLELLPGADYRKYWLKITDRHHPRQPVIQPDPADDPYTSIYLNRHDWWKLIDENLLNPDDPLNTVKTEEEWSDFNNLITKVKAFHEEISGKYHPVTYSFYGKVSKVNIESQYLTQETAVWTGKLHKVPGLYSYQYRSPLADKRLNIRETKEVRTVEDKLLTAQEKQPKYHSVRKMELLYIGVGQQFTLRDASENGDGTVPVVSGQLPDQYVKERLALTLDHEGAYRNETAQKFTLRSIVKIAQQVHDDDKMSFNKNPPPGTL